MSVRVGVVLFPGTNCELDVAWAVEQLGAESEMLWHADATLRGVEPWWCRAGSRTATTCAPAPLRASRRS